jgi:hypothetical protein
MVPFGLVPERASAGPPFERRLGGTLGYFAVVPKARETYDTGRFELYE